MTGLLLSCVACDCDAVDRVVLEVGEATIPAAHLSHAVVTLAVADAEPTLHAQIGRLHLAAANTSYSDVDIVCTQLVAKQPQFACGQGTVSAHGGPTGAISMQAAAAYDSASGALSVKGSGLALAGADAQFDGTLISPAWSLNIDARGLDLIPARKLAAPWVQMPAADSVSGHLSLRLEMAGRLEARGNPATLRARLTASTTDLDFTNQAGTAVGQRLAASLSGTANQERHKLTSDVEVRATAGQALAGPVLLDFGANPLQLQTRLEWAAQQLALTSFHLVQKDLLDARGQAVIGLGSTVAVRQAHLDVPRLETAAAYRTFAQIAIATTDFGALHAGGYASGSFDIADNAITAVNAHLQSVSLADPKTRLSLANANGDVHWVADAKAPVEPSLLSWSSSSAYGLIGGAVELSFVTRGRDFALSGETRFPIFDGALVVHKLAVRRLGATDAELDFDAHLEPLSMPLLSKAFGWPTLSGQLAGAIPGVTYRDRVLAVEGDLSAVVFDGTIVGSRLKLLDPFGPWPRLNADVTARRLDLDLLTHTFSIGSITGRLDADIKGLELFNWSPIAFEARLQSTPGDRSKHLISQKAVTSISSVGGGGGGVTAALQSGVLKFFDKFHYDRIGISCQLRDEVCLMNGLEPARTGYYMVKGRGIPRIDIIGNAGRVDWPQLVSQIAAGMNSQNIIVR